MIARCIKILKNKDNQKVFSQREKEKEVKS